MYAGAVNRLHMLLFHEQTNRPSSLRALVGPRAVAITPSHDHVSRHVSSGFNHASLHKTPASVSCTDAMHKRRGISCVIERLADERLFRPLCRISEGKQSPDCLQQSPVNTVAHKTEQSCLRYDFHVPWSIRAEQTDHSM